MCVLLHSLESPSYIFVLYTEVEICQVPRKEPNNSNFQPNMESFRTVPPVLSELPLLRRDPHRGFFHNSEPAQDFSPLCLFEGFLHTISSDNAHLPTGCILALISTCPSPSGLFMAWSPPLAPRPSCWRPRPLSRIETPSGFFLWFCVYTNAQSAGHISFPENLRSSWLGKYQAG